ncbi:hypothetical protein PRUPE_7G154200 [Prunus persica]|uniref:Uncharacterized protein n=1 Tax=Prunus persica TaxID=3760 RepID=M5W7C4_PRUPE|nr:hypothetical protein PRUPE_7G154200 [Prunus persica]
MQVLIDDDGVHSKSSEIPRFDRFVPNPTSFQLQIWFFWSLAYVYSIFELNNCNLMIGKKFGLKSLLNCLVIWLIIILWGSFILFTVIHFYMLSCAIKQGPMRAQISHPHHSLIQFIMQYFAIHTYKTKCQYICSNSCLYFTTILV